MRYGIDDDDEEARAKNSLNAEKQRSARIFQEKCVQKEPKNKELPSKITKNLVEAKEKKNGHADAITSKTIYIFTCK